MSYRELFAGMTPKQLDQDVTFLDADTNEFYKLFTRLAPDDDDIDNPLTGVLDSGHVYLTIIDDDD